MGTMMMKMSITEAVCQLAIIRTCDTWFRPYLCSIRLLSSVVVDECFISKKKKMMSVTMKQVRWCFLPMHFVRAA